MPFNAFLHACLRAFMRMVTFMLACACLRSFARLSASLHVRACVHAYGYACMRAWMGALACSLVSVRDCERACHACLRAPFVHVWTLCAICGIILIAMSSSRSVTYQSILLTYGFSILGK